MSRFIYFYDDASCEYFWPVDWNQLDSIMVRVSDLWKRVRLVCMWYISIAEVDGTVLHSWKGNILFAEITMVEVTSNNTGSISGG